MPFFSSSSMSNVNWKAAFNDFSCLSPPVAAHVSNVYAHLTRMVAITALAAFLRSYIPLSDMFAVVALIGSLFWFASARDQSTKQNATYVLAAAKGVLIAPLIDAALVIQPGLLVTALLGTTTIFLAFTLCAMYARRREYLYLGGMLSSAISLMAVLSIANIFLRAETLFLVQLYGGLMVFSGYIVYDTQLMVEKAHAGQYDVAEHALQLWLDFVAVFVRVLIILLRNAEKKSRENNDNRNRSSNRR